MRIRASIKEEMPELVESIVGIFIKLIFDKVGSDLRYFAVFLELAENILF